MYLNSCYKSFLFFSMNGSGLGLCSTFSYIELTLLQFYLQNSKFSAILFLMNCFCHLLRFLQFANFCLLYAIAYPILRFENYRFRC